MRDAQHQPAVRESQALLATPQRQVEMKVDHSTPSEERGEDSRSQYLTILFERARSSGTVGSQQIRDAVTLYVKELCSSGMQSPEVLFAVRQTLSTQILVSGTDRERDSTIVRHFVDECTRAFYRIA
jgi:hypothetical protein